MPRSDPTPPDDDDSERLLAVYERYDGPTGPTDKSAAPAGPTAKPAVVLPTIPP